jgi:hypothetical protein
VFAGVDFHIAGRKDKCIAQLRTVFAGVDFQVAGRQDKCIAEEKLQAAA